MECPKCLKPTELCVCAEIQPLENRVQVLILQHPQEPDKLLGTARVAQLSLQNSALRVGLSWRNLSAALQKEVQPSRWAVLYLGSGVKGKVVTPPLQFVSKQGAPVIAPQPIDGLVVLDGTWSQAKALWWRNPWLLKLRRAVLVPPQKSLYGKMRKEPRGECLSTIESIALSLTSLGEPAETQVELTRLFSSLLKKAADRPPTRRG